VIASWWLDDEVVATSTIQKWKNCSGLAVRTTYAVIGTDSAESVTSFAPFSISWPLFPEYSNYSASQ
jgi:hypothetical protein